ncbi:MAG: type III PLP-dependent enzyme [candidate division Zixibacteria bacterium]|nr:type III PLP-dependent enzyme [candidate division Zixibacteria bacterium]
MTRSTSFAAMEQAALSKGTDTSRLRELFTRETLETPLLVLSRSDIGLNYDALKKALPRVSIHYAVKPNNHQVFIDEVYRRGGNFDVCSAGEIKQVMQTGINPATLVHSHPVKSIAEFDFAVGQGVETFVVDNPEEIKKFARYKDKRLKVLVRFRISTNSRAVVNLQYKFGCSVDEVLPLARLIRQTGHDFYGLCFHIGSQCVFGDNYVKAIKAAHDLIHDLDLDGFDTRLLDIGGGFPVEYVVPIPSIDSFCAPIRTALDKHIRPGIRIISEPGRFIAASPVTLVCSVIGRSVRDGKIWYYLDDGLYSTFSGILYDHCQYPVINNRDGEEHLSVLAGPTCDSFDVMYDGLMIPVHEVGDRIIFPLTGAYCAVSGSNFNALKRPNYEIVA